MPTRSWPRSRPAHRSCHRHPPPSSEDRAEGLRALAQLDAGEPPGQIGRGCCWREGGAAGAVRPAQPRRSQDGAAEAGVYDGELAALVNRPETGQARREQVGRSLRFLGHLIGGAAVVQHALVQLHHLPIWLDRDRMSTSGTSRSRPPSQAAKLLAQRCRLPGYRVPRRASCRRHERTFRVPQKSWVSMQNGLPQPSHVFIAVSFTVVLNFACRTKLERSCIVDLP